MAALGIDTRGIVSREVCFDSLVFALCSRYRLNRTYSGGTQSGR